MTYTTNKTDMGDKIKLGGYENLVVYWLGVTIYELNLVFC